MPPPAGKIPTDKLTKRMAALPERKGGRKPVVAFVILAGSFNPPHLMHVESLEAARRYVETYVREPVICGFLCPSSDGYMRAKLGDEALGLPHRVAMCAAAVAESHWLETLDWGWANGEATCQHLQERLQAMYPLCVVRGYQVAGADHVSKYSMWRWGAGHPLVCLGRPGYTDIVKAGMREYLDDAYGPGIGRWVLRPWRSVSGWLRRSHDNAGVVGPMVVNDIHLSPEELEDVSSTRIRELMQSGHYRQLATDDLLAAPVAEYLEAHEGQMGVVGHR